MSSLPRQTVPVWQDNHQVALHRGYTNLWGHLWQGSGLWVTPLLREMSQGELSLVSADVEQEVQVWEQGEGGAVCKDFHL